jgi:hypothetical protein
MEMAVLFYLLLFQQAIVQAEQPKFASIKGHKHVA